MQKKNSNIWSDSTLVMHPYHSTNACSDDLILGYIAAFSPGNEPRLQWKTVRRLRQQPEDSLDCQALRRCTL
jgi:hypothetical protein